jgi:hypothetical protein
MSPNVTHVSMNTGERGEYYFCDLCTEYICLTDNESVSIEQVKVGHYHCPHNVPTCGTVITQ